MYDYLAFFYKIIKPIHSSNVQKIWRAIKISSKKITKIILAIHKAIPIKGSVICISMACSDSINNPIHNFFKTSCDQGLRKLLMILDLCLVHLDKGMKVMILESSQVKTNEKSHSNHSEANKPSFILTMVIWLLS